MAMKRVGHLCLLQIKELLRNPTFYAYLCLFFVYYHYLADGTVRLQQESGLWVNAWGYAAGVFSNYQSTLALGLGAVMLFSDLPLVRECALFEATRCSRNTWIGGRILYVGGVSVLYASLMLLLCAFTSRGRLMETSEWGKLLNTLANGYGFGGYHVPVSLSLEVTQNLTPLAAFGLTVLMSALATAAMGLMMLCLSLIVGRIGAIAAGCMVAVLDFVIYQKLPFWCYWLSPLSFTRLSIVYCPKMPYYPTWQQALVLLLVCNALCILLAFGLAHCNRAFAKGICKEQY